MKLIQEEHLSRRSVLLAGQQSRNDERAGKARRGAAVLLAADERKVESILAMARVLLAGSLLAAIYLAPHTAGYSYLYRLIFPAYCAYTIGLIALFRRRVAPSHDARTVTHVVDIMWAGALLLMISETPYSPSLVFLIFPLLAAAMRWGFRATMITTVTTIAILIVVVWVMHPPVLAGAHQVETLGQNGFAIGSVSLLILGFLLGFLGDHEKQLRGEATAVARVSSNAHKATTPNEAVSAVFEELFGLFDPAQIQLAIHEIPTGRIHVWEAYRADAMQKRKLLCRNLDFQHREEWLFESPGYHLLGSRAAGSGAADIKAFDASGKPIHDYNYSVRKGWFPERFRTFACVPIEFGNEWEVRLFLWNPVQGKRSRGTLRALSDVTNRLAPTIFAAALQQHLRSRATAEERARFARELHDGIMQSLVALDMKMEVMKKMCPPEPNPILAEVTSIQRVLRSEVLSLRELIQHNRRIEIGPTQLLPFLSQTVSTFQREAGITARFISELEEVSLPAPTCYEVARIVQEALTNVRKHSGSTNVIVRFAEHADQWILVITDDGRGFDFVGRFTLAELDAARKGPKVIKERVRSISGDITIESGPDSGARLEIIFPKEQE